MCKRHKSIPKSGACIVPIVVSPAEAKVNPYATIDKSMDFLDRLNLDTFAKLARAKTSQFSTFTQSEMQDIEHFRDISPSNTLIPSQSM